MGSIVRISAKSKKEDTQKALRKLAAKKNKVQLADFYGKLPDTYEDGLDYQKKVRNEW